MCMKDWEKYPQVLKSPQRSFLTNDLNLLFSTIAPP